MPPPWTNWFCNKYRKLSTSSPEYFSKMARFDWTSQHDYLRIFRRLFDWIFLNRRLCFGGVLALLVFLYFFPNWIGLGGSKSNAEPSFWCLHNQLNVYNPAAANFDAFVRHYPNRLEEERVYVPFVGNGYFGLGLAKNDDSQLRIQYDRALGIGVGLQPVVTVNLDVDYSSMSRAYVTDVSKGKVTDVQVFRKDSDCITVETAYYAHRTRPEVFVQEITVRNPTNTGLTVRMQRSQPTWSDSIIKKPLVSGHEKAIQLFSRKISVSANKDKIYVVTVALPEISEEHVVGASSSETFRIMTLCTFAQALSSEYASQKVTLEESLAQTYAEVASMNYAVLWKEHENAWSQLWSSGFHISHSKAPDVLNGDIINTTIYYVLSNSPSLLYDITKSEQQKSELRNFLYRPDRCYTAHNTLLYPSRLWSSMNTVQDVVELANRWKLTLEKRGCTNMLKSGADGVLLAMVLSFGALKFTNHHMEFDAKPQELHRDYTFRQIAYGNNSFINIWVIVGADNKPTLYVSVNHTGPENQVKKFYACDAGCMDNPVELSSERTFLPVKLTEPATPILYVTDDRKHIEELKHSIHVKEVVEAPAHEHHVIAMHKHGHRLGGLPALFWVTLAFLLITFHLFLFNLIYNEYCRDEKQYGGNRSRYSV